MAFRFPYIDLHPQAVPLMDGVVDQMKEKTVTICGHMIDTECETIQLKLWVVGELSGPRRVHTNNTGTKEMLFCWQNPKGNPRFRFLFFDMY